MAVALSPLPTLYAKISASRLSPTDGLTFVLSMDGRMRDRPVEIVLISKPKGIEISKLHRLQASLEE